MKFLRHLTAVVLTVAVIVGLGLLWAHASGDGTYRRKGPPPVLLRLLGPVVAGVMLGFLLLGHVGHWLSAAPGASH